MTTLTTRTLRDALLAVLRADGTMSTDDLAAHAPWQRCEWHCRCHDTYIGSYADCDGFRLVECRGTTDIIDRRRTGTDVYTHLRALERQGLATRQRIDGHPCVYWSATHIGAAVDELAQLEAMWAA